jgi:Tol biopolymer transport system component
MSGQEAGGEASGGEAGSTGAEGGSGGQVDSICVPGELACDGNRTVQCNADGTGFLGEGQACSATQTCEAGVCREHECVPGQQYCAADAVRKCAANGLSSTLVEACDLGSEYCEAATASCKAGVCAPQQPACDGNIVRSCNADGSGFLAGGTPCGASTTCSAGACQPWVCDAGHTSCDGNTVKVCAVNGLSSESNPCPSDETCVAGACTGVCGPAQKHCASQQPQACDANGAWVNSGAVCSASTTCVSGVCGGECGPNQKRCSNQQPQKCNASGSFVDEGAACTGSTPICADGGCLAAASTERVSISSSGVQANDESKQVAISADGRFVTFSSAASNLVDGDTNGYDDIFVRDRVAGTTTRVSDAPGGVQANRQSEWPSISADGRYVAFASRANNLLAGQPADFGFDTFVYDRQTGTLELVSVSTTGGAGNGQAWNASLSADGRYVAFESTSSNLVVGDTNNQRDVFIRDRQLGTTERVSLDSDENQGNGISLTSAITHAISTDGRYVAFGSSATNLIAGDNNNAFDFFLRDRSAGTTTLLTGVPGGGIANSDSAEGSLSGDGRYFVFRSQSSNLIAGDTNGFPDVFLRDIVSGTTERISTGSGGVQADEWSIAPAISQDGSFIVFCSRATNFVPGDTNAVFDVYGRPRTSGVLTRVSVDSAGAQANALTEAAPAVSNDGQYVAIISLASNLVAGDTNAKRDVFVRRLW